MRVLILVNGDAPSEALAQRLAAEHDRLFATDGAAHRAVGLGLTPDVICGDFDSVILDVARAEFARAEFLPMPDQAFADLEKAIHLALERGASSITIIGAAGGRIDHTLGNFALLLRYHADVPLRIVDDVSEVWAVSGTEDAPGETTFAAQPGDLISLLSLDGAARVRISGVKWPLHDAALPIGTHGISNAAESEQIYLSVRGGAILVCHLHKGEGVY
jgi:thiamine pyrophosphokinase